MEKPAAVKQKGKNILKYMQKPASFGATHRPKVAHNKAFFFSGPLVPDEARRRSRNGSLKEPTSPKVSCMGQIKLKKSASRSRRAAGAGQWPPRNDHHHHQRPPFSIKRMFQGKVRPCRKSSDAACDHAGVATAAEGAPKLGDMKKFMGRRGTKMGDFDWIQSDRKFGAYHGDADENSEDEDDEEVIIQHSAPILIGAGRVAVEPKKEVNIWKRRPMAPPAALNLKGRR